MSIQRRLALSFLAILVLFGLNLLIYFWSNSRRSATVEALARAVNRQILLAGISQQLNDLQKQVALLSQVIDQSGRSSAGPEAIAEFNAQLQKIGNGIQELQSLSEPSTRSQVETFGKTYQDLSASWGAFYRNLGANQSKAILELVTRADPLSQRVIQQMLPQLQEEETQRVQAAKANFYKVARWTDRLSIIIFALSTLVGVLVAYFLSRYLTRGLGELKIGAAYIGSGILNHRISIESRDELGDLARGYNEMAENLHEARKELTHANLELEQRNQEANKQRQVAESLLLNILPAQVAEELQANGKVEPKYFEDVSILFTDFVGFTLSTEKLAAEELVQMLHDYFTAFDQIVGRYHLEKLKTIGDSYMCVAGLPLGRRRRHAPSHPVDAVMAALEMKQAVIERDRPDGLVHWSVRIGIHSGPVVAGVVGIQKFAFDIWGDSVNYSSRMESSGAPNRINVSSRTHSRVKDFFECEHRGRVLTKDKKEEEMYFCNGVLPSLMDDLTQVPPPAFLRRYRVYFQKDPPAFPAFLLEPSSTALRVSS